MDVVIIGAGQAGAWVLPEVPFLEGKKLPQAAE